MVVKQITISEESLNIMMKMIDEMDTKKLAK